MSLAARKAKALVHVSTAHLGPPQSYEMIANKAGTEAKLAFLRNTG